MGRGDHRAEMIDTLLKGRLLSLVPFEGPQDFEYLRWIQDKAGYVEDGRMVEEFGKYFWRVKLNDGRRCGVVYVSHYPTQNMWVMSGFGDVTMAKHMRNKGVLVQSVISLVVDFVLSVVALRVFVVVQNNNGALIKILGKCGFKPHGSVGELFCYVRGGEPDAYPA